MNNLQNYRIIEKAKFYVQKKTKIGWVYKYAIAEIGDALFFIGIFIFASLIGIIEYDWFILVIFLLIILQLIIILLNKKAFSSFNDAEDYIKELIAEKKIEDILKTKTKIKKYII